ncbi:MAG: 50S ribosomal protein L21 [Bdellovibrionaceae bacterium]|nr:50S ribosomal protein L21 [Pseudobdellovibrionaceae bacterium]|tara:strand:- start:2323 stop:2799 length:477 start_codon:yes stop_codon:yes gene_type:complete
MYAVIHTGGKQYRVQPGDIVEVEKLQGEPGQTHTFNEVLFVSEPGEEKSETWLGKPFVNKALVEAEFVAQGRGKKVTVFKMKRRQQYRKKIGHRQELSQLLITKVDSGAGKDQVLSDADKKTKLSQFATQLKPKGLPRTPKTLGSRVRMKQEAAEKNA